MAEPLLASFSETSQGRRALRLVQELFADLFGIAPDDVSLDSTFLEMGADSLFLLRASQAIQQRFGVRVAFRRLVEELDSVAALAEHLAAALGDAPPQAQTSLLEEADEEAIAEERVLPGPLGLVPAPMAPLPSAPSAPAAAPAAALGDLQWILAEQLRLMTQQLELLGRSRTGAVAPAAPQRQETARPAPVALAPVPAAPRRPVYVPFQQLDRSGSGRLTPEQQAHLDGLIERVGRKTGRSKEITQTYRQALANNRASAGFRMLWKDLVYPLHGHRAAGSRLWDVDGNEYLDMTMGFGSLLLGHSPDFMKKALHEQVERGVMVGPESDTAGRAAALICELTGHERATFCNSGTEAVMTAVRLARAVTGRSRIAIFAGSYHGTFDGILAKGMREADGRLRPLPLAPGVPKSMIEDVLMLDYESESSLDVVAEHAGELAAVLVEPRQSRRPDHDARGLLRKLRALTEKHGIALVFDEVVTGFRMHPGGIQALYGVHADIATYGKAVANGLPIGVVAGAAKYMDALDGGFWQFGDRSLPEADMTFFAGTFFRHPLVMAGVLAVLEHLKANPQIPEVLGRRTDALAAELNGFFADEGLPVKVAHFGSLFTFFFPPEWTWSDLLFFHMLEKGIYVWERRVCYLSTAHSEEDVRRFVAAVKESVGDLRRGGFLPASEKAAAPKAVTPTTIEIPLTEAQRELWALAELGDDASAAYNLPLALRLRGAVEPEALRRAAQQVTDRHEALRITVSPVGDVQRIGPRVTVEMPVTDVSGAVDPESAVAAIVAEEARRPFDLAAGPVQRLRLVRRAADEWVLCWTVHHIAADGQSLGILMSELVEVFSAAAEGRAARLPEAVPFREYVKQINGTTGAAGEEAESFWKARFAGSLPVLDLPTDRPRPATQTFAGATASVRIEGEPAAALRTVASRSGATTTVLFLAAVQVLLHRLTGGDDLVIGLPAAGQPLFGGCLVGYCLNVLPLRFAVGGEATFADLLRSTRGVLLDAYENQGYPLSRLMRTLGLSRDPGRRPLVAAMLNVDHAGDLAGGVEMGGLTVELMPNAMQAAQLDVEWNVIESSTGFTVDLLYNSDLFDAATAERWQGYLVNVLTAISRDDAGLRLDAIELMGEAERVRVLEDWNRPERPEHREMDAPLDRPFPELFAEQARRRPTAMAAVSGSETVTYGELDRRAEKLARVLAGEGVGPDAVVGLLAERGIPFLTAVLGIWKAGGAYLPLDPQHPAARRRQILAQSGARWVLCAEDLLSGLNLALAGLVDAPRVLPLAGSLTADSPAAFSNAFPKITLPRALPENLSYVIYTSGSTGLPKGAMIHHRGMLNHLWAKVLDLGLSERDAVAQTASQCFDISVWQFLSPLLVGGRVHVYGDELAYAPLDLLRRVDADGVTILEVVPSLLRGVLPELERTARPGLAALRWLLLTGEALPPELVAPWLALYPRVPLLNAYGPTECSDDVAHHALAAAPGADAVRVPVGRPVANTRLYVTDRRLRALPPGVHGELCVGGAGVGRGYLHDPARTAAVFVPDPFSSAPGARLYCTGDLSRFLPDGAVEFLGRLDHQVKVRGFRIELGEIEAVLARHPGVRQAVVLAREDAGSEKRLVGYVAAAGAAPSAESLREHLRASLPEYMVPPVFVVLDEIPLTPNGKVDRRALPAPAAAEPAPEGRFAPPLTANEKLLAGIWAALLKRERIGVHDNFFTLGGDSILAIQLIARSREAGLRLAARQIFEHPTIAGLAEVAGPAVEGKSAGSSSSAAEQGMVTGEVPLTPIQRWFFDRRFANPHHWNMAVLREPARPLDPPALKRAVAAVVAHHDALRLRFAPGEHGGWTQRNAEASPSPFLRVDLAPLAPEERSAAVTAAAARFQASLDLTDGPLLRVVYFDFGERGNGRLLIVVHHMAIDIVSWGVLLEDLERAYMDTLAGRPVTLPAKTTSFRDWARTLDEYAQSDRAHEELGYWLTTLHRGSAVLPTDFRGGANLEASTRVVNATLGERETQALIHELPKVFRAQVSDALLTALALTFAEWTAEPALLVDLEGHGRELLGFDGIDGIDLSRTVGWFTSLYPVLLDIGDSGSVDPAVAVKRVKEQRRAVPQSGIGFGLLCWLSRRHGVAEQLAALPQAEVSFNYQGRLDGTAGREEWLRSAEEGRGVSHAPDGARSHLLEIDGYIEDGRLTMAWIYSESMHRRSTIETLARSFNEHLARIVERCAARGDGGLTPSDFPKARLDQGGLDKLVAKLGRKAERRVS